MSLSLKVGQRVEVSGKNVQGVVSYVGTTQFATGKWIGVTLDEPKGKNNGTVQGKSYFQCKENHGMFVRQTQLCIISDTGSRIDLSSSVTSIGSSDDGSTPTASRITNVHRKSPPTQTSRTSKARPRASQGTPQMSRSREDMATPATVPTMKRSSFVEKQASGTPTGIPRRPSKLAHTQVKQTEFVETLTPEFTPGQVVGPMPTQLTQQSQPQLSQQLNPQMSAPQKAAQQQVNDQHNREIKKLNECITDLTEKLETLKVKYREKHREAEEARLQVEHAAEFKARMIESQAALKKDIEKAKAERQEALEAASDLNDLHDILEMATLDKEMAEEKAEALQRDLEVAQERITDLELKIELMKAEKQELVEGATGDDPSVVNLKVKQLEAQNEKLKDTLVRLRDLSAHEKHEKQKLERDYKEKKTDMEAIVKYNEKLKAKVLELEEQIADLHSQVDAAMGAEEMVETLGQQKLSLEERVQELEEAVAELEELQDVNNQLQENFREQEQEYKAELEERRRLIWEAQRKVEALLEGLTDRELTITKFRDHVQRIQEENNELRARLDQKSLPAATSLPAEFIDFKKMFAETKAHARAIDLELRHMEVELAQQHIQYLLAYMPDSFLARGGDHEAVLVVLLMPRLLKKCQVLLNQLKDKFPPIESVEKATLNHAVHQYAARCRFSLHLHLLQAALHQLDNSLNSCTPETLLKIGASHPDMLQQEKALDAYIDLLKKDHLDENVNTDSVERMVKFFRSVHSPLTEGGETEVSHSVLLKDTAKAMLSGIDSIATDSAILELLLKPVEGSNTVLEVAKKARVWCEVMRQHLRKAISHADVAGDQPSLDLGAAAISVAKIAKLLASPAKAAIHAHTQEGEITEEQALEAMIAVYERFVDDIPNKDPTSHVLHSMSSLSTHVANVSLTLTDLIDKYQPTQKKVRLPPLTLRAKAVKAELNSTDSVSAELESRNSKIRELKISLRAKQEELSEMTVRKDLVESRLSALSNEKKTAESSLKIQLEELQLYLKKKEYEFETTLDHLQKDIETLEQEKAELKEKLKNQPKKPGVSYETVKPVHTIGGSIDGTGDLKVVESPILISQIHQLKEELRQERAARASLDVNSLTHKFNKLKKLKVRKEPSEADKKKAEELFNEVLKFQGEMFEAMLPVVPDLSRHRRADPANKESIYAFFAQEELKKKRIIEKFQHLQTKVNNEVIRRNSAACVKTDFAIFPSPEMAKAMKEFTAVPMCQIDVPSKNPSLLGKTIDLQLTSHEFEVFKKHLFESMY